MYVCPDLAPGHKPKVSRLAPGPKIGAPPTNETGSQSPSASASIQAVSLPTADAVTSIETPCPGMNGDKNRTPSSSLLPFVSSPSAADVGWGPSSPSTVEPRNITEWYL